MVRVKLEHVTKRFGETVAVDDMNLTIKDRELAVVVGPSGCGKTTTIRLIAGLERVDSGKIYFDDEVINNLPIQKRKIAMVFQDYALYPHMTNYDNMAFGLRNLGYSEQEIKHRIHRAASILGIEHLLKRKPKQLSGGQQQRVALGRAIVREPKVFLWDEPLSNLDAKMRVTMRSELKKLQRRLKTTTIHVTHDQLEAMTMADRVVVMHQGSVRQVGTPDQIYDHPADTFVAGFIGTPPINFIRCSLNEKRGTFVLDAGEFQVELPSKLGKTIVKGATTSEVLIGIRPEDVKISGEKAENPIPARVEVVEPVGSDNFIHFRVGKGIIVAKTSPDVKVGVGSRARIVLDVNKMHVFDGGTEKAIL